MNQKMIVFNPKILQNTLTLISSQIKRKTLYWVSVEIVLIAAHVVGVVFMFEDIQVILSKVAENDQTATTTFQRDLILMAVILAANMAIGVLDLQYIHLCMVLCKRYRL